MPLARGHGVHVHTSAALQRLHQGVADKQDNAAADASPDGPLLPEGGAGTTEIAPRLRTAPFPQKAGQRRSEPAAAGMTSAEARFNSPGSGCHDRLGPALSLKA